MNRIAAVVVGLLLTLTIPLLAIGGSKDYYYSDGVRIDLVPADDWIAVRFTSAERKDQPSSGPQAVDFTATRNLVPNRLTLLPIVEELSAPMRGVLIADLAAMPEVVLVAPVYRAPGALMIVTDEFIVSFPDGVARSKIDSINQLHGVEVVRKLLRSDNTWLMRVVQGDALETANTYHGLGEVAYSHPDFVRVMPPRPADFRPGDTRLIIAPDGSLLPPDTVIEKGRNDLRIIEPSSRVFPGQLAASMSKLATPPVSRATLKTEGFEAAFPNDWVLYGDPTWGAVGYRSYSGAYSGYSNGSSVEPPGPYDPDTDSWMVYGPFSLADAIDARLDLQMWVDTEAGYDYLLVAASLDGSFFNGNLISGNWAANSGDEGWMNFALDLKRVPTLGDLRGEEQVWVGLYFHSDNIVHFEGVYVDEIVLEKITGGYQNQTSDEFEDLQWSLSNNQQLWGTSGADIKAVDAWDVTHGSDAITIAVLDQGVDLTHPDLAAKLVPGFDATGLGSAGAPSGDDAHGTNCAGIAAAITDNALGVAGIAREAKIMPVRLFYSDENGSLIGSDSGIADAFDWAVANGADVLTNSWGGGTPVTVITEAIADARSGGRSGLGAVVTFSSGNGNGAIHYPANLDTVLTVGATSPCDERKAPASCDGELWWGSNYGPELDIAAPGVHMYSTDISGAAGYDPGDYNYNFNGTSSATPVVAGVAALLLGQNPAMTASEVEAQLMGTADDLAMPGWDQETGFGRVNAYRALTEALPDCFPLSFGHTGLGTDPIAVPLSSPGCAAQNYFAGETVYLTAAPSAGWVVASWSGTEDNANTSTTNIVTMPASPRLAQVHYVQIPCFILNLGHSGSGADPAANPPASPGCDEGNYHAGEWVSLSAEPAVGWAINGWSGTDDNASIEPVNEFTMPGSGHAAAVAYVEVPPGCYILHRTHTGLGGDPVPTPWNSPGCPGSTFSAGATVLLEASADQGWTVGGWMGTDDDGSFLWVNSLDMPVSEHTVTARYVTPTLVKDIRPGAYGAFNRDDYSTVSYTIPAAIGSTLLFAANDGVHGMELWKSDGTPGGTSMVRDIWPGSNSAFPWSTSATFFDQTFVSMNGNVFFAADDRGNNYELWKSDGTFEGTVMVKDTHEIWNGLPMNLTNVSGTLFFILRYDFDPVFIELWKSDGTEEGTVMVRDMTAVAGGITPGKLTAFGDLLIFRAGGAPWISDGTEGGTVKLKDITVTSASYSNFMQLGDEVFFSARIADFDYELWKSDGTGEGTVLVKDIAINGAGSHPNRLTAVGDTLFFQAVDTIGSQVNNGRELWKSDGTEAGTVMVKNIRPGYLDSSPMELTEMAGRLVFIANDYELGGAAANYEPWISDGTEAGTQRIAETYPGLNPINWIPRNFEEIGDTVFFAAYNHSNGKELWQTDGTGPGTAMVGNINPAGGSYPDWLIDAEGVLFLRADDGSHGSEIWALVDDSRCHSLGLNHTGQGTNPTPDPANSQDCDIGYYAEGEVVTLTASPDPDWSVGSWSGSDNDGSSSAVNTVTMPAVSHAVTVHYSPPDLIFAHGFE